MFSFSISFFVSSFLKFIMASKIWREEEGGRREGGRREEGRGRRREGEGRREEGGGREEEKRGGRGRKGNNRTMQLSFKVSVTIPV